LKEKQTIWIKEKCRQLGFDFCGIAPAQKLDDDARRLENWLLKGMHGKMQYMENYFDLRTDPYEACSWRQKCYHCIDKLFPEDLQRPDTPKIAKYAYGDDYHEVIREKLRHLLALMKEEIGEINGRGFVDSAPVLERSWATKSGLGWIGKNGNLINKQADHFFYRHSYCRYRISI
jgi:epoxyqueuosine reductase